MKNIVAISLIIVSLITIGVVGYLTYTNIFHYGSKGIIYSSPSPGNISEAQAVSNLEKALPVQEKNFTIDRYDIGNGQFIVTWNVQSATADAEFNDWRTKNYPSIPTTLFGITNTANQSAE